MCTVARKTYKAQFAVILKETDHIYFVSLTLGVSSDQNVEVYTKLTVRNNPLYLYTVFMQFTLAVILFSCYSLSPRW
jgi:hypothetical protein